jgi:general secretion pathway protein A
MYHEFYGLRERPFELTANPRYLFMTARHREALSTLEYGLFSAKALTLLIGEAGTGKSTLLQAALRSDRCSHVRCIYVNNPALTRHEFVQLLAQGFALPLQASMSKTALLGELERLLRDRRQQGEITALVVDEAQSLSTELLEEVRLLGNIETSDEKLLPLILAGQPELSERLEEPSLRQLKQRVALRCELRTLELSETAAYVASRIRTAGGTPSQLFTRESVTLIHEYSRGIPRTISVICDNALVSGMALGRRPVDRAIILEVCEDFHLTRDEDGHVPLDDEPRDQPASPPADEAQDEAGSQPTSLASRFRRFGSFGTRRF